MLRFSRRPRPPAGAPVRVPVEMEARERFLRILLLFALLYGFLAAVDMLGSGFGTLGRERVDALFAGVGNPLAGLCIGVLATVLAQSSSVTTPTIVALVGSGVLSVGEAVPIVMGANIGTTVTNTLASLGSIRRPEEFRRAFTGATMHDVFNVLSVAILLPVELATGMLSRTAVALSGLVGDRATGEFHSPAKAAVAAVTDAVSVVTARLPGEVLPSVALMGVGLAVIFGCLYLITRNLRQVMAGPAERSLNATLERSGLVGLVIGVALTVAVQSSSITTSFLIPLIAAGVLTVPNAFPITLGANIGTTLTALLAAMAVPRLEGLQIALTHLLFNLVGVLLFFPIPAMRRIPLVIAARIGDLATRRRSVMLVYVVLLFYVVPLIGILLLR